MSYTRIVLCAMLATWLGTTAAAQPPAAPPTKPAPAPSTATTPAPSSTSPQPATTTQPATTQPPVPAPTPTVVGPGKPEEDGKVPKAATVKETEPAAPPAMAPADSKPVLSAPTLPADVLPIKPSIRYFILIFGSESVPKRARFTHTWMTIVKATPRRDIVDYDPQGNQEKYYDLLAHTISWLPQNLNVRVLRFRAECGVNLDLEQSIRYTSGNCERIALWGPYEINPLVAVEVYEKTLKQIAKLKSGRVMYKAVDFEGSAAAWCKNCIHAVSDLDGEQRRLNYNERTYHGWIGSQLIVRYMANANRIETDARHEWVAQALGLNKYCISRQNITICRPKTVPVPAQVSTAAAVSAE